MLRFVPDFVCAVRQNPLQETGDRCSCHIVVCAAISNLLSHLIQQADFLADPFFLLRRDFPISQLIYLQGCNIFHKKFPIADISDLMVQVSVRLYQSFILGPQFLRNSGGKGVRPADQAIMPRLIQTVRTLDIDSHHRLSWILLRLAFKAFFPNRFPHRNTPYSYLPAGCPASADTVPVFPECTVPWETQTFPPIPVP